ncbi:MAG TPA: hypothetical protein VI669_05220 [Vicinamibacteria bacterium]
MNTGSPRAVRAAGLSAAAAWLLLCLRWFDVALPWRPDVLALVPPWLIAVLASGALLFWVKARWSDLVGPAVPGPRGGLLLVLALAALFRLPVAWSGAAGAVTPDGALSGIVALHVRDGVDHLVFVPHVPYSGSLKSHLAAPIAALVDAPRAFALASLGFYLLFVAAAYALALRVGLAGGSGPWLALGTGLYLAFSPPYVTRYSLSNDGNYVEVLGLGTLALLVAVRWMESPAARSMLAVCAGAILGLAFWCHILAVVHLAAVGLVLLLAAPRDALRSAPRVAAGFALGDFPGLLWNAANHWGSFQYLVPGAGEGVASPGPSLLARALGLLTDQLPFLLGYDPGYAPPVEALLRGVGVAVTGLLLWSLARAVLLSRSEPRGPRLVLLVFVAVNLLVALLALPQLPGNPRYLLFLMAPAAIFMAEACAHHRWRPAFAVIVIVGALSSLAQGPGILSTDAKWRAFAESLRAEKVRFCYTDFYLATKINFLTEERVVCTAKLGPTTTEYFFEYRRLVEGAPEADLIAVNKTAAQRLERRLTDLGIAYERRDLMKPVLLRLSRKVDPEELFPGREFPWR